MTDIKSLLGENLETEKRAMFHGGFNYLDRIDKILRGLDMVTIPDINGSSKATINGLPMNMHQMRLSLLQNLYKELYPKMNNKEKTDHKEAARLIKKIFYECMSKYNNNNPNGVGKFIPYFDEWELELRDCVERKGLLMPSAKGALEAASE